MLRHPLFLVSYREPLELGDAGDTWSGYRYRALGHLIEDAPLARRDVEAGLRFFLSTDMVQVWRAQVFAPGTDLYAEVQWRPGYEHPEQFIGGWPKHRPNRQDITRTRAALELMWTIGARLGRPMRFPARENAVFEIHKLYARERTWKSARWNLEEASEKQLASWLRCDLHTLRQLERRFGISLDDIRNRRV